MPPASAPILVVDDDAEIRDALRASLEIEGYAVVEAASGVEALAILSRGESLPSVVLLDWSMAPMNAMELMTELAKEPRLAAVPVVLITADGRAEKKAKMAGFVDYLAKPIRLDALMRIIDRYT
jgi:CheY-like chemotaxis protein